MDVSERTSPYLIRWAPWIIGVLAVLARAGVAFSTGRTAEDALITLRYAENLAAGQGYVYNPGEHVLGTTTPLYTILLAVLSWLHGPGAAPIVWGKVLNILADGATCVLLCLWMRRCEKPCAGLLAAALYAVDTRAVNWNGSGMETGLVTLAGIAAIAAYAYGRSSWSAIALALLALLRFDGLLLAGILLIAYIVHERKFPLRPALLFLALLLPWMVFAFLYFGSPVPTSIQAKLVIYPRLTEGAFPHLGSFLHQMIGSVADGLLAVAFVIGTVRVLWIGTSQYRIRQAAGLEGNLEADTRSLAPALIWTVCWFGLFATAKLILFGWYLVPPLPIYLAIAAFGFIECVQWVAGAIHPIRRWLPAACCMAIVIGSASALPGLQRWLSRVQADEDAFRRPVGEWLRDHTHAGDTIMVESIGYIGYYSQRRILDAAGLVSPRVLSSYRKEIACPLWDILKRFHPPLALLYEREYAWVKSSAYRERESLEADYDIVRRWPPVAGAQAGSGFVLLRYKGALH